MNWVAIIIATAILAIIGLVIGLGLGLFEKKFGVETNPQEEAVLDALPGNNCGACGFAGCSGLATAIAAGKASVSACPVGGDSVAQIIAGIMGQEVESSAWMVAYTMCNGDCNSAKKRYDYIGLSDCVFEEMMQDQGSKACSFGCLGEGSCVKACQFGAIKLMDGIAVINRDKCKGCGKCVSVCPKHIIKMVPYSQKYLVLCSSTQKGKKVIDTCQAGCISCTKCVKACPFEAIVMENNIPKIDPEKCKGCGKCAKVCPKGVIRKASDKPKVTIHKLTDED